MRTSWLNKGQSSLQRFIWSFAAVNFSVCLCFYLKPCWVCSSSGTSKTKDNWPCRQSLESVLILIWIVLPSPLNGITQVLRAPSGALGCPLQSRTPCSCTQMRARWVPFLLPASQVQMIKQQLAPDVGPVPNTGNAHSNNSMQIQPPHPGLHGAPWHRRACEGQFSAENTQQGESLSVHKAHKYWYLCTHIISQNWIFPLRASTHFTDVFVSPDVADLNYKTSIFMHSIYFHTEWKQMKLSFFFSFFFLCTQYCDEMKLNMTHFWDKHSAPSKQEDCSRSVF